MDRKSFGLTHAKQAITDGLSAFSKFSAPTIAFLAF